MSSTYLEIQEGSDAGKRFEISEDTADVLLGRSPDCHFVVAAPSVSRRHARLRREAGRFFLEDLGSANGTSVNGERLKGSVEIHDQDRIVLGAVQTLFVHPPPPAPEPEENATMLVPPEADATIAVPPAPPDSPAAVEETPPAPEPPASPSSPAETATASVGAAASPGSTTRTTRTATATATERLSGREEPGVLELVLIGAGSFLAVFGLGWLLM